MNILTVIVFIVIFVLVYKLAISFSSTDQKSKRRIAELLNDSDDMEELHGEFGQEKSSLAGSLEGMVKPFKDTNKEESRLKLKLMQAGWSSPNAPAFYMFAATFGWIFAVVLGFVFYQVANKYEGGMFLAVAGLAMFCCLMIAFGAQLALDNSIKKRQETLVYSFPDALDLLLVCVESGLAIDAAMARVCKELKYVHPEITEEINKTRYELAMLNDREKAFNNLAKRTNIMAFKSLVGALVQAEKFGVSLVDTLRVLADDYRSARMMAAEEKAAKLPTKITVASIPLMILALILLITAPAAIKLAG